MKHDLVIRGGRVIDPLGGRDEIADVAIESQRISSIGHFEGAAVVEVDAAGCMVIPGAIDTHAHALGPYAHRMLARAGVTTVFDLAGPINAVLRTAAENGVGLNLLGLEIIGTQRSAEQTPQVFATGEAMLRSGSPATQAVDEALERALRSGAIGVKLHFDYPLDPDGIALVIARANAAGCYVAQHCGSTATASDLSGLRETIELVGPNRLQVAHVNSYCRGRVGDPVEEAAEALRLLESAPHLFSESYLGARNGANGKCVSGRPVTPRVCEWLREGGYPDTTDGMRAAIEDEFALAIVTVDGESVMLGDRAGVDAWLAADTDLFISFPLNPGSSRLALAVSKTSDSQFGVDAIATDGGFFPRNNQISAGLALVYAESLTLIEWLTKISLTPARVLGLPDKGHLSIGAEADIAIVDPLTRQVRTTIASGSIVMHDGDVVGSGTRVYTNAEGVEAVRASGCEPVELDVAASGFYTGEGLKVAVASA